MDDFKYVAFAAYFHHKEKFFLRFSFFFFSFYFDFLFKNLIKFPDVWMLYLDPQIHFPNEIWPVVYVIFKDSLNFPFLMSVFVGANDRVGLRIEKSLQFVMI